MFDNNRARNRLAGTISLSVHRGEGGSRLLRASCSILAKTFERTSGVCGNHDGDHLPRLLTQLNKSDALLELQ